MAKNNGIDRKEIKPERFFEGVPERTFETVDVPNKPEPKDNNMFKSVWSSVKATALKQLLPTLKEQVDVDIDVEKNEGSNLIIASVTVKVLGKSVYNRVKSFKI